MKKIYWFISRYFNVSSFSNFQFCCHKYHTTRYSGFLTADLVDQYESTSGTVNDDIVGQERLFKVDMQERQINHNMQI